MTLKQLSDLTHGNVHIKREMLAKEMNISTRNELLTELKLDHLVNKSVDDYTQDEVLTVFKGWNNKYGNMINNIANKATSIKARLKNQIGTISNANYAVNQVMYETYLKDHEAPEDIEYYLCGPPMMSKTVLDLLHSLGVEDDMIRFDDFGG